MDNSPFPPELFSMAMTYRHDFGLLSRKEQVEIYNELRPIYEHHVKPRMEALEKADALAKEMTDLYTPMTYDGDRLDHVCCYCGAEGKEPHKIGSQHEASMKALAAYQEARHG